MRRKKRRKLRRKGMKYLGFSENSSRRTRPPHVHLTTWGSWSTSSSHGGLISTSFFSSRSFLGNGETASCWSAVFGLGRNKDSRLPWRRTVNLKQSNFSSRDHSTFNFNLAFGFHFPNIRFSHEGIWKESP